jgi:hypothetical protein
MEYVSTAKWRERRWRLFSTFIFCMILEVACHVKGSGLPMANDKSPVPEPFFKKV